MACLGLGIACSSDDSEGSSTECGKDTDCPGNEVCESGSCVAASGTGGSSGSGGAGGSSGSSGSGGGGVQACETDEDCDGSDICAAARCVTPGQCDNQADKDAVLDTYERPGPDGGTLTLESRDIGRECGVGCLFKTGVETDEQLRDCTLECITDEMPLSQECGWCLVFSVECGREFCLSECLDSSNPNCFSCVCGDNSFGENCIDRYEACAGVPSTTCDDV